MQDILDCPFALSFKNILLKHSKCIVNSRSECDITTKIAGKTIQSPIIPSNMPSIITLDIARQFDKAGWFHIFPRVGGIESIKDYIRVANDECWDFVSISIGVKQDDVELLNWIYKNSYRVDSVTIDVALSWQNSVEEMIKNVKQYCPAAYLIVGNGDSPEWISWLENLGVDCAKVNIGVSSACRTREFTGFGSSTITDLVKCKAAAKNIKIMSDGGITRLPDGGLAVGDVAKALVFGADYVLSGALFSQCLDSPCLLSSYYGNSTARAKGHSKHVEGAEITVSSNGRTIKEQMGFLSESLKSSVSYAGGKSLKDMKGATYQIVL